LIFLNLEILSFKVTKVRFEEFKKNQLSIPNVSISVVYNYLKVSSKSKKVEKVTLPLLNIVGRKTSNYPITIRQSK